jgi:hypothetical protein
MCSRCRGSDSVRPTIKTFEVSPAQNARPCETSKVYWYLRLCLVCSLILSATACAGQATVIPASTTPPASATLTGRGTPVAVPTLTPIPGLKATLTALPKQSPMPEAQARPYRELRQAVEQCAAYHENRKIAILQQIDYVTNPATVPPEFVSIYGDQWPGQMIYGSAYLSALEWKLAGRDRASCLYPIGVSFNALLRQLGRPSFPEFD